MSVSPTLVEYRLEAWPPAARESLESLLTAAAVPVEWRASSLLVPTEHRAAVRRSIALLDPPPPVPVDDRAPPGWYVDPLGQQSWRWWDGHQWLADGAPGVVVDRPWVPEREDHEHAIRGGLLALLGFVAGIALSLGLSLTAVALGADEDSLVAICAGQAGLWSGLTGACLIAVHRSGSGSLRDLGLVRLRRQDFGVGAVAAIVMRVVCALVALVCILIFPIDSIRNTNSATTGVAPSVLAAIVIGLIVCIGAPFFEELFFRGLVQGVLTRRWGARIAIIAQAIGFALVHYRVGMTAELTLTTWAQIVVAGLVLGCLRWRYERLGPGMVAHGIFNAIAIAIVFSTW